MTSTLQDIARIIRSKNAGPTQLTIDVLFTDNASFQTGLAALTAEAVGVRYGRGAGEVTVIAYPPALAVKIVMNRLCTAGLPGDRDVYGAQQHGPLLGLPV
jgi:outer membrane protein W